MLRAQGSGLRAQGSGLTGPHSLTAGILVVVIAQALQGLAAHSSLIGVEQARRLEPQQQ